MFYFYLTATAVVMCIAERSRRVDMVVLSLILLASMGVYNIIPLIYQTTEARLIWWSCAELAWLSSYIALYIFKKDTCHAVLAVAALSFVSFSIMLVRAYLNWQGQDIVTGLYLNAVYALQLLIVGGGSLYLRNRHEHSRNSTSSLFGRIFASKSHTESRGI